MSTELVPKLG